MRCPWCGAEAVDGFRFCLQDGSPLPKISAADWPERWQARLRRIDSQGGEHLIPIERRIVGIGRGSLSHVVLDDPGLGPREARLTLAPDGFAISQEPGARGSVLINGAPLDDRLRLEPFDRIQLGNVTMIYEEFEPNATEAGARCSFGDTLRVCGHRALVDDPRCLLHAPAASKDVDAFWQAIRRQLAVDDLDFRGYVFPADACFGGLSWEGRVDFADATFTGRADFSRTAFGRESDFTGARFCHELDFTNASFADRVVLSRVSIDWEARFGASTFRADAKLDRMTLRRRADFQGATFMGWVDFAGSHFAEEASFAEASFSGWSNFSRVTFGGGVSFAGAQRSTQMHFFDTVGLPSPE